MQKVKAKDFKYLSADTLLTETDTKALIGHVSFYMDSIVYHIKRPGDNVIYVYKTLEDAIEAYNKIP